MSGFRCHSVHLSSRSPHHGSAHLKARRPSRREACQVQVSWGCRRNRDLFSQFRGPGAETKVWVGIGPFWRLGGRWVPGLSQLLGASGNPSALIGARPCHFSLSLQLRVSFLSGSVSFLSEDTVIRLGAHPKSRTISPLDPYPSYICKGLMSKNPLTSSRGQDPDVFGGWGGVGGAGRWRGSRHKSTHSSVGAPGHPAGSHSCTRVGSWLQHEPKFMAFPCTFVKAFLSPQPKIGSTGSIRDFLHRSPQKEKLGCFEVWCHQPSPPPLHSCRRRRCPPTPHPAAPRVAASASLRSSDQKTGRGHCGKPVAIS